MTVRVLVVDDSAFVRKALTRVLNYDPDISVVAQAADGKEEWCAVGDGEMDNLSQIRALLKSGYKEYFTLETHYKHPLGKAHATRTSLTALLKVFAAA